MTRPVSVTARTTIPNYRRWPRQRLVCVRRPGLGKVHFFELACGHAKLVYIHGSAWREVNRDVGNGWLVGCPVCYMEQRPGSYAMRLEDTCS